jgi:hypothetical protein
MPHAKDGYEVLLYCSSVQWPTNVMIRYHTLPEKKLSKDKYIRQTWIVYAIPLIPCCRLLPRDETSIDSTRKCAMFVEAGGACCCRSKLLMIVVIHFMSQCSDFSFKLLNAQYALISNCFMVLAHCIISLASLTGPLPVASDLGRSAINAGIDSASFSRPLGGGRKIHR